ncbi:major facilitator superfamily domain-containing protein [Plectosphaerella cucumerina]|uniref:Major facilitator superfamily domain-containing protein n=1 Tax=Plectosphaerella cucumerina TaxID=40658 RepID=A0A8K0X3K2_9PEZI|nr:major facilitator superfamily domain-containing protein [Plectosphaerella cucumerina]
MGTIPDKTDMKPGAGTEKDASISDGIALEIASGVAGGKQDKALALLADGSAHFDPDSPEAKGVLRKIDTRIMPMILVVYILMLVDKNSLSYAKIMNIQEEASLTASEYSWLGSVVYFGYLAGEIPVTYLMQRVPLAKFFSVMVITWGAVMMFHGACKNFASLMVVRFILGALEVCAAPVIIYILGSWYNKKEQVSRVAIWYTSSGWAHVFGGFFAWCIYHAPSFRWQALFIFEGGVTVLVGIFLWFFLAGSPTDAGWLSDEEKRIALERCRSNKTGTEVWKFNKAQLVEAFCDPRFYLIFLMLVSTGLPNGGLTVFGPSIISAFGFTSEHTTLLSMAPGIAAVVGSLVALIVAKYTNRTIAGMYTLMLSCIGTVMMLAIPPEQHLARYGGYILTLQFPVSVLFIITFMTAGVGGSTKKLAFGAAYQIGYTVGNIIGPQTYRQSDAPDYYTAKYTMLAFLVLCLFLVGAIGSLHWYWNRKRDRQDALDAQNGVFYETTENEEFADLTDFQVRSFRYPI